MMSRASRHGHDFVLDGNGEAAEIDGPVDLADLMLNLVAAARTSPAAQLAKLRRAHVAADLEIAVFLAALNQHVGPIHG